MSILLVRTALWAFALLLLLVSASSDLRDRIIPNEAVLLIAAIGLGMSLVSRPGSVWTSLAIALVLFCGLWVLVVHDIVGGGDAKLIAAVTLLVPPDRIGLLLIAISLAGGALSAIYLVANRALRRTHVAVCSTGRARDGSSRRLARFLRNERSRIVAENSVPYALAVLGGVAFHIASELYQCLFATSCSL